MMQSSRLNALATLAAACDEAHVEVLEAHYFKMKHCRKCDGRYPAHLFGIDKLSLGSGTCVFCQEARRG